MAWEVVRTIELAAGDGQNWEIDLLTGVIEFETPSVGKARRGVMASAHNGGDWKFKVTAWVERDAVGVVGERVLAEARRRVEEDDWQSQSDYELT